MQHGSSVNDHADAGHHAAKPLQRDKSVVCVVCGHYSGLFGDGHCVVHAQLPRAVPCARFDFFFGASLFKNDFCKRLNFLFLLLFLFLGATATTTDWRNLFDRIIAFLEVCFTEPFPFDFIFGLITIYLSFKTPLFPGPCRKVNRPRPSATLSASCC